MTPAEIPQFFNRLNRAVENTKEKKQRRDTFEVEMDMTDWRNERPYLNLDITILNKSGSQVNLDMVPNRDHQDFIIIKEILLLLIGSDSELVQITMNERSGEKQFTLNGSLETLEAEFVKKCLPLATYFSTLAKFVEDNSRLGVGRVNQALSSYIDKLLHQYQNYIAQLEGQNLEHRLHLHDLWLYIQHVMASMKVLSDLVGKILEFGPYGGQTLSVLQDFLTKMMHPVTSEAAMCLDIMKASSVPFMESIRYWIYDGIIYDPFDEFMIVESHRVKKEADSENYWEKKYQLRPQFVPNFLEEVQDLILNAGKYLNVIKECVKSEVAITLAPIEDVSYNENKTFIDVINKACKHSSLNLLSYMLNEYSLMDRIASAKKYFLLQQGDFVVQMLDTCEEELINDINDVVPSRLASLVEMAIRIPSTNDDVYREHITSCLKPLDLASQVKKILLSPTSNKEEPDITSEEPIQPMSGFESFTLTLKCEWPVSLVFNCKVLSVYQMLFRHLFYCKHIERLLSNTWIMDQSIRSMSCKQMKPFRRAVALRNKMMFFLTNMEYYMMDEAIEPAWIEFNEKVKTCGSIDDLMHEHWIFLEKCVKDCLLTNLELLSVFRQILTNCKEFTNVIVETRFEMNACKESHFDENIERLDNDFQNNLHLFLSTITQLAEIDSSIKLLNLFYRQNFNYYYNDLLQNIDPITIIA